MATRCQPKCLMILTKAFGPKAGPPSMGKYPGMRVCVFFNSERCIIRVSSLHGAKQSSLGPLGTYRSLSTLTNLLPSQSHKNHFLAIRLKSPENFAPARAYRTRVFGRAPTKRCSVGFQDLCQRGAKRSEVPVSPCHEHAARSGQRFENAKIRGIHSGNGVHGLREKCLMMRIMGHCGNAYICQRRKAFTAFG